MQTLTLREKAESFYQEHRLGIATGLGSVGLMVSSVSATTDLSNVTPIIDDVVGILPSVLNLVIGVVPIIIALAFVGFLVGLFDSILGKIRL